MKLFIVLGCGTIRDVTFVDGEATIYRQGLTSDGEIYTIIELPEAGYTYTVEIVNDTYSSNNLKNNEKYATFRYELKEGSQAKGTTGSYKNVKFGGKVRTMNFKIQMNVYGDIEDFEYPFTFFFHNNYKITPKNELTYSGSKTGVLEKTSSEMGILHVSLKNGEYVIVEGLPVYVSIWANRFDDDVFRENNGFNISDYFFPDPFGTSGSIDTPEYDGSLYVMVRRWDEKLVILKAVEGVGIEEGKEYIFKIKGWIPYIKDENIKQPVVGKYPYIKEDRASRAETENGMLEFNEEGIAYITLKGNEYAVIGENYIFVDKNGEKFENRIPLGAFRGIKYNSFLAGTEFEIEELENDNYNKDVSVVTKNAHIFEVNITNTRKFTGKLTINKKITNEQEDSDKEFKFKIKLTDAATDLPKEYNYTGTKEGTLEFDDNFEATITLKGKDSITIEGLPVGAKYEVVEEDYKPNGYITAVENAEGNITEDGETATFTNTKKIVYIDKISKLTGEKLEGAELILKNSNGDIIEEWVSTNESHRINAMLGIGEKYVLEEKSAPAGYVKSEPIEFTVEDSTETQKIEMKNNYTKVVIKKVDENGKYVKGVVLAIKDLDGNEIEKWTTEENEYKINAKLKAGEKYIIEEVEGLEEYEKIEPQEFTVNTDGTENRFVIVNKEIKQEEPREETNEPEEEPSKEENKEEPTNEEPVKPVQTGDYTWGIIAVVLSVIFVNVIATMVKRKK